MLKAKAGRRKICCGPLRSSRSEHGANANAQTPSPHPREKRGGERRPTSRKDHRILQPGYSLDADSRQIGAPDSDRARTQKTQGDFALQPTDCDGLSSSVTGLRLGTWFLVLGISPRQDSPDAEWRAGAGRPARTLHAPASTARPFCVPEGLVKIARQFTAGYSGKNPKSRRDG